MTLPLSDPEFAARAAKIKLFGIDFDGVMTDNRVYVFENGQEAVVCSRLEGYGLRRVAAAGVRCVIVSTEENPVVSARAAKLKIPCHQNIPDKVVAFQSILDAYGLTHEQAAFIGNDINDLELLKRVGLPIIVADAHEDLDGLHAFRTRRKGGDGAVREACDAIAAALELNWRKPT
jgi:3-deoxy-D-manno-octulosonate 8-phosphate phosphatase (KDO 8-P phosphatase)